MEENDTDNAVEDTQSCCWRNQESMERPAVSQVKKDSDNFTEEGIDEDMLNNSALSQDTDKKHRIKADKRGYPEKCLKKKLSKCPVCGKAFNWRSRLKQHMTVHTGTKPYLCSICGDAFSLNYSLTRHKKRHAGLKPHKCLVCEKGFYTSSELRVHMIYHTKEKPHKCSHCSASFARLDRLRCHLKSHADEMSHGIDDTSPCDNLESDLQIHKDKKQHKCTLCDVVFTRPLALKHHLQTHNQRPKNPDQQEREIEDQEEGLSVPEDSMSLDFPMTENNHETRPPIGVLIKVEDDSHAAQDSFSGGSSESEQRLPIDEHTFSNLTLSQEVDEKPLIMTDTGKYPEKCLKMYTGKKPYKCPVCEKSFSDGSNMKKHIKRHTGLKPHKCLVCEKGFYSSPDLRVHMKSHTGEKSHRCSQCDSAFARRSDLNVHMRIHTGEKPFKCHLCQATFSQGGHLKTHIMTHSGERPYKCSHCDAAFTTGGVLKTHLRTHTGEKPHRCSYCVATFARLDHLRFHINTHTGEMLHKCQECNTAFNRPTDLMLHMRTHTGEKPHKCPECNSAYTRTAGLRRHMKIHTRNKSHKCSYCTATFNSSFHLKSHLKNHGDRMFHENDDTSPSDNIKSDLQIRKVKKRHKCKFCNAVFARPFALKRHLQTHSQRPRNTDQQKNQIEESKEEILPVQENFMSVDFLKAEGNNEPRPPIEVFIKVEDDVHAAHDSFPAGGSRNEQRLSVEEVRIKGEDTHVASAEFISSCDVPYLQDNVVKLKEEKKEMADQEWTHCAISSL